MIEWEVLEEERLPDAPPDNTPPRKPFPWKPVLLFALVALLIAGGGVAWRLRVVREQLRDDIQQVVTREERAIRLGVSDQAESFADPSAPATWQTWYRSIFTPSELPLPAPVVEEVVQEGDRVLATLTYTLEGRTWQNSRAYRLVNEQWRRSYIPDSLWGERPATASPFFVFRMTPDEQALLDVDALTQTMSTFRAAWGESWAIENNQPITITFSQDETRLDPQITPQTIILRSPLVNPTPTFEMHTACSLGVLDAVAQLYSGEISATGEEQYLRMVMRQAIVDELTRTTDGLCEITERTALLPPSALDLPPAFGDYLIQVGGRGAAHAFIEAFRTNDNLDNVAQSVVGHPLEVLRYGAEQYSRNPNAAQIAAAGTVAGGINYGEIVRGVTGDDLTLQIRERQGVTIDVVLANDERNPTDGTSCLTEGSQVVFTWETNTRIADVRVLSRPLTPIAALPLSPTATAIYQRINLGTTYVYAISENGQEEQLFRVPTEVQVVANPYTAELAFLTNEPCGWVLNEYEPTYNTLQQWFVPFTPERIVWVGNTPAVSRQRLDDQKRSYWQLYRGSDPQESLFNPTSGTVSLIAGNRGELLGYNEARDGYLVFDDRALNWTDESTPRIGSEMATLPFRFTTNVEFSSLSADGQWLAYTLYPADGRADLNLINTVDYQQHYLATIPPDRAGGESRWATGDTPTLAVIIGSLGVERGSGMTLERYAIQPDNTIIASSYRPIGEISNLHWCQNSNTLTMREDSPAGPQILGLTAAEATPFIGDAERMLWCQ